MTLFGWPPHDLLVAVILTETTAIAAGSTLRTRLRRRGRQARNRQLDQAYADWAPLRQPRHIRLIPPEMETTQ